MDSCIEKFNKRWDAVEQETLSSVRRQMKAPVFDISEIIRDFQRSCDEWFRGKLGPSIWYQNLVESRPEKASVFKDDVMCIQLKEVCIPKPRVFWIYLLTILSLPAVFFVLDYVTDWALLGRMVFAIGIAVLVWTACKTKYDSLINSYEDSVVDSYRNQLEEHRKKLIEILS